MSALQAWISTIASKHVDMTEDPKKYVCDFAGCEKSFKRADYLERHRANHSEKPRFECEHCKRGFARADVLAKHVGRAHGRRSSGSDTPTRHLSDEDAAEPPVKRARSTHAPSSSTSTVVVPAQTQWVQLRDIQSHGNARAPQAAATSTNQNSNGFDNVSTPSANIDFSNASYNVDGLFSLNALASVASGPSRTTSSNLPSTSSLPGYGLTDITNQGIDENVSPATADSNFEHTFAWLFGNTADASSFAPPLDNFSNMLFTQPPVEPPQQWSVSGFESSRDSFNPQATFQSTPAQPMPIASTSTLRPTEEPVRPANRSAAVYPIDNRATVSFVNGNTLDEPKSLIDNARRAEMLNILQNSPDREAFDTCFTCKKLNSMVELYFIGFDPFYPVLHRPTMPYRPNSPFLLLAVVFLGTAWAQDKDAFNLASRLHRNVRQSIFTILEDNPNGDISLLQSLLLINTFGRMFASPTQHSSSQLFHSPSIVMANFLGVLSKDPDDEGEYDSTMNGWMQWANDEERIRVGWLAFLLDTCNSALYRHPLMIHVHSMKIRFPCPDNVWQKDNVMSWAMAKAEMPQLPSLLEASRSLISKCEILPGTSNFVAWILLHALISISWALLWRDMAHLSMSSHSRVEEWKSSLQRSFRAWQTWVCENVTTRSEVALSFYFSGIPFCYTGIILLLSETERLRIYAGAPRVAGRVIGQNERNKVRKQLAGWVQTQDASLAAWAALQSVQFIYSSNADLRMSDAPATTPWCLYLACLTIYVYGTLHDGQADFTDLPFVFRLEPDIKIEPSLARRNALAYIDRLLGCGGAHNLSQMPHKNTCGGVIAYAVHLINAIDWGILQGPGRVLKALLQDEAQ